MVVAGHVEDLGALADGAPWVRFSQSEDLTVRLRNIIHDYAFGPGVFRELLQNADDAGARRLVLFADGRSYPATGPGLLDPRLGAWQGPAICAFNDAEFTDADFEGICRVGASMKRGDHAKIGHYGLGFNASYHLSDVVSFVSRDRLCMFDPHEAHLPSNLPGLQLPIRPSEAMQYAAQLAPFEAAAAACDAPVWPLKGAIFRLPLRTPELAERSMICRESHDIKEIVGILCEFLHNAHELLIFLQSVEHIEVLVQGSGDAQLIRLGSASLRTASDGLIVRLRHERRLLARANEQQTDAALRAAYVFAIDVETPAPEWKEFNGQISPGSTAPTSSGSVWFVASRAEAGGASTGKAPSDGDELPKRRCGAIAVRLWPEATGPVGPVVGRAFCFLPLSLDTGMPVHVSANFALTANRRDLWRRSDDRENSHGTQRALWNEALLSGTLLRVYADALELRADGLLSPSLLGGVEASHKGEPASLGAARTADFVGEGPWGSALHGPCEPAELWALWPATGEGCFAALPGAVSAELIRRDANVLWVESRGIYATPKQAMLCSEVVHRGLSDHFRVALGKLRVAGSQRNMVEVPERLCPVLAELKGAVWLRPQSLATALRSASPEFSSFEADAMVEYLLGGGAGALTVLHGLRVAPLASGGLGRFEKPGEGVELWWAENLEFHKLLPHRPFIDPASNTFALLKTRAANAPLNIRLLNACAIPAILPVVVPPTWKGRHAVTVSPLKDVLVDGDLAAEVEKAAAKGMATKASDKAGGANGVIVARAGQKLMTKEKAERQAPKTRGDGRGDKRISTNVEWDEWRDEMDGDWDEDVGWGSGTWAEGDLGYDEAGEASSAGGTRKAMANTQEEIACTCETEEELDSVVQRCILLWQFIESVKGDKGVNPVSFLCDFPCVPVRFVNNGESSRECMCLRLLSIAESTKRHALAFEDFNRHDQEVLAHCGVPFIEPGQRLRKALLLDKSSLVAACLTVFENRWHEAGGHVAQDRLHIGLKPRRVPVEDVRPLRRLLLNLMRKNNPAASDPKLLEALPLFETQGGCFAVPLSPVSARVLAPNEEWDEALRPQFADYLVSWEGETGELLSELRRERGSSSSFLASFAAPRAGLFGQELCVLFLEAVAALGAAPWKKQGASKELVIAAHACAEAPVVVYTDANSEITARRKCSEVADPGDAKIADFLGDSVLFPPQAYRSPLLLQVMRAAGLRSLADDYVFLEAARAAEASGQAVHMGGALLRHLGESAESLKWPTKAYTLLSKYRIFPVLGDETMSSPYPPASPTEYPPSIACALVGPCTLLEHAPIAWNQLPLLDPALFATWPRSLLKRFGALQDPPGLETVIANLCQAATRWEAQGPGRALERQVIVERHLAACTLLLKRSRGTQVMVQSRLARTAFVAMDDGALAMPADLFHALHAGGDSSSEGEEEGETLPEEGRERKKSEKRRSGKTAKSDTSWSLPKYLRRHRRLLLTIAGPSVDTKQRAPRIYVCDAPKEDKVPNFMKQALNQPELADVEFVVRPAGSNEETIFYGHRLILAAACDHFHKTFTSGLSEATGSRCRIELPDWITPRPFLWMLAYLYRGFDPTAAHRVALLLEPGPAKARFSAGGRRKVPLCFEDRDAGDDLCCLLRLSSFYALYHLLQWSEHQLQEMLTPDNIVAISTHAYFCEAQQLLRLCVHSMQLLYGDLVGTAEWEDLEPAIKDMVLEAQSS